MYHIWQLVLMEKGKQRRGKVWISGFLVSRGCSFNYSVVRAGLAEVTTKETFWSCTSEPFRWRVGMEGREGCSPAEGAESWEGR